MLICQGFLSSPLGKVGLGTKAAFIQTYRGGSGRYAGPGVDDGSAGYGAAPTRPPEYPVTPGGIFGDQPQNVGTPTFVVCKTCIVPCCGGGVRILKIGPCREWKAGFKGDLDDTVARDKGKCKSMDEPPSWFVETVEKKFPGVLGGRCYRK